ncbi:unnamed protein product [Blepharisma stoltei]|uniref:Uncharacterized protein n=1 Tax=Blepharisma stoltei TaxID=1481888 RepID=A0AAU9JY97_9CILI|nr:unnamed protein product [Blepharisma stoltei]
MFHNCHIKDKDSIPFEHNYNLNICPPELPKDFGLEVLNKEFLIEKSLSVKTVQELVDLYTKAIEHYSYKQNPLSHYFQSKLKQLLSRFDVIQIMNNHSENISRQFKKPIPKKKHDTPKKCIVEKVPEVVIQPPTKLERTSTRIISQSDNRIKDTVPKILKNCRSQEDDLNFRLLNRKRQKISQGLKKLQLSSSFTNETCSSEHLSISFDYGRFTDRLEQTLEEIMERNCSAKISRITEIQVNYNSLIREIEDSDFPDHQKIADLKEKMQNEISRAEKSFKTSLKEELNFYKQTFL